MARTKEYFRAWRVANPEKVRASLHSYRARHPEDVRARKLAYRKAHPPTDESRAKERAYRKTRPGARLAYNRAYYALHQQELIEKQRAYAKAHPEVGKAVRQRRRAQGHSVPSTLTSAQWRTILVAYKHRCAYCGTKPKKLTIDHVVPLSRKGTNTPDNVVPACLPCNLHKHNSSPVSLPAIRLLL